MLVAARAHCKMKYKSVAETGFQKPGHIQPQFMFYNHVRQPWDSMSSVVRVRHIVVVLCLMKGNSYNTHAASFSRCHMEYAI